MNHAQHKFLTTAIVFIIMIIGVFIATSFRGVDLGAMSISLLLTNALLLLIILGILLQVKEGLSEKTKKKG